MPPRERATATRPQASSEAPKTSGPCVARERSERALRRERLYGQPLPGGGEGLESRDAWPHDMPLRVGTSGWAYRHWLGRLYPRDVGGTAMLPFFARRFPTVEVNSTYYRLPEARTFDAWRDAAPPGFRFSVKAPGSITHEKRLVGVEEETAEFVARASRLHDRLGVLLFQLPPGFRADLPLLEDFLRLLPEPGRCAFELRHRSWHERDVRALLERHGAAWVVHDYGRRGSPLWTSTDWVYLRLHGPSGRYRGAYPAETLLAWAQQALHWLREGRRVWVFFNNDERGHAVRNAVALREALAEGLPADAVDLGGRGRAGSMA